MKSRFNLRTCAVMLGCAALALGSFTLSRSYAATDDCCPEDPPEQAGYEGGDTRPPLDLPYVSLVSR